MTNDLNSFLKQILSVDKAKAFCDEADDREPYPYSVFELKTTSDMPVIGTLEVNVWDSSKTYSRANDVMDKIEKKVKEELFNNEKFIIRIYPGQRQSVKDPDNTIKRIREQFDIRIAERK